MNIWYDVHGGLVHFPIAAAILSFVFDFGGMVFRRESWRAIGFWLLLVAATAAVCAVTSGFIISQSWLASGTPPSWSMHRNVGIVTASLLTALALWRGLKRDNFNGREFAGYITAAAMAAAAVGFTGYLGGKVIMFQ
jgi:uncharacterized membrane protein